MATFLEALGAAVRAATCNSVREFSGSWLSNLREKIVPEDARLFFDTFNCTLCGTCEDSDAPDPPFLGGQCVGVGYRVTYAFTSSTGQPIQQTSAAISGPITGVVGGPTNQFGGVPVLIQSDFPSQPDVNVGTTIPANRDTIRLVSLERVDGQPDSCGDPDLDLPPPGPITTNINVTYEGDDGDITIPFGLIFAPIRIGFDGSINVPIDLDGPLFDLSGNVELFPNFNLNLNPPNTNDKGPAEVDNPGIEEGEPGLDGEDPPKGPDEVILGVYVRSRIDGRNLTSLIPDSPGPDILVPGVGTVRFAIRAGGLVGWTQDIRVKGVNEFVYCPVPWGAVSVSVRSEVGWANSFTVLRGRPTALFVP